MEGLKPENHLEPIELLFGARDYEKVYYCKQCGARLRLGQIACQCGLPIVWEGVSEWEKIQRKRKSCKR